MLKWKISLGIKYRLNMRRTISHALRGVRGSKDLNHKMVVLMDAIQKAILLSKKNLCKKLNKRHIKEKLEKAILKKRFKHL